MFCKSTEQSLAGDLLLGAFDPMLLLLARLLVLAELIEEFASDLYSGNWAFTRLAIPMQVLYRKMSVPEKSTLKAFRILLASWDASKLEPPTWKKLESGAGRQSKSISS